MRKQLEFSQYKVLEPPNFRMDLNLVVGSTVHQRYEKMGCYLLQIKSPIENYFAANLH